jgi:hypothetical protein
LRARLPEATIRDIVVGELNRRDNPKMLALRKGSVRFWETQERRARTSFEEDMARERAAGELESEKSRIMQDLFSVTYEDFLAENSGRPDRHVDLIDRIAPASRPRARELLRSRRTGTSTDRSGQWNVGQAGSGRASGSLTANAEMKAFLSDSELEEFDTHFADRPELRNRELVGFAPSEEEFARFSDPAGTSTKARNSRIQNRRTAFRS